MLFKIKKRNDNVFSQYPCSTFLHNALRFISEGKTDIAYEEICWALIKGGEELTQEEKTIFKKLMKESG